jgi:hypothetical protein
LSQLIQVKKFLFLFNQHFPRVFKHFITQQQGAAEIRYNAGQQDCPTIIRFPITCPTRQDTPECSMA